MTARTVAVVGGGRNPEHEVALRGAAAVAAALVEAGHGVLRLTIDRDGGWLAEGHPLGSGPRDGLAAALALLGRCDAVFPVLHGAHGEDGTLAALADLAGVPLVGCGLRAGAIAMDKHATKALAASLGIAVVDAVLVLPGDPVPDLEPPLVVKPTTAGSSFGVSLVRDAAELPAAIALAASLGDAVLVERFMRARELHIGVLERASGAIEVLPPLEFVKPDGVLFDTSRKYEAGVRAVLPAPVDPRVLEQLRDAAVRLFRALGCSGLARVDFFVGDEGAALNEVNTMPGMTAQSGFPMMAREAGLDYPALVSELVEVALRR